MTCNFKIETSHLMKKTFAFRSPIKDSWNCVPIRFVPDLNLTFFTRKIYRSFPSSNPYSTVEKKKKKIGKIFRDISCENVRAISLKLQRVVKKNLNSYSIISLFFFFFIQNTFRHLVNDSKVGIRERRRALVIKRRCVHTWPGR